MIKKPFHFTVLTLICFQLFPLNALAAKKPLGHGYEFENNGKRKGPCFKGTYSRQTLHRQLIRIKNKGQIDQALKNQIPVLKKNPYKKWRFENMSFNHYSLIKGSQALLQAKGPMTTTDLMKSFAPYLIKGEDGCGNTHFTAYYTPVFQVKSKPDSEYKYPLYKMPTYWPKGKRLTRHQIDTENRLAGRGLEVAYSKSLLSNFFLQVQGSGRVTYIDTKEKATLQYAGQNGFAYSSVGRYLVKNNYIPADKISLDSIQEFFQKHPEKTRPFLSKNKSYTFFKKNKSGPRGSLSTEVVSQVTVAVDRKYIPLGAVLLAEIPQLDASGKLIGHTLKLMVAQDTGGAIRGAGHVDIYMGAGKKAQDMASHMHHYGRLWLLVPKK